MSGRHEVKNTPEQARELAIQSIDLLMRHGLAPSPLHYAVAFEYFRVDTRT